MSEYERRMVKALERIAAALEAMVADNDHVYSVNTRETRSVRKFLKAVSEANRQDIGNITFPEP